MFHVRVSRRAGSSFHKFNGDCAFSLVASIVAQVACFFGRILRMCHFLTRQGEYDIMIPLDKHKLPAVGWFTRKEICDESLFVEC
jgi:hypothetical protein